MSLTEKEKQLLTNLETKQALSKKPIDTVQAGDRIVLSLTAREEAQLRDLQKRK